MKTPQFSLIEFKTNHGLISAVVKTSQPDTIVFGFTDHGSCIGFLRKNRQRRYLQNGGIEDIPVLPGNTRHDKELDTWYQDFLKEIYPYVTEKTITVLHTESQTEIDHCTITDTSDLDCYYAPLNGNDRNIVFAERRYSTWYGRMDVKLSTGSPEDRRRVIELIQANKEAIIIEITTKQK